MGESMDSSKTPESLDLIWGAIAIGEFLGLNRRQSYHVLENGFVPANKVGDRWVASRDALRRHISGSVQT